MRRFGIAIAALAALAVQGVRAQVPGMTVCDGDRGYVVVITRLQEDEAAEVELGELVTYEPLRPGLALAVYLTQGCEEE